MTRVQDISKLSNRNPKKMNWAEYTMIFSTNEPKWGSIAPEKKAFHCTTFHWLVGITFPHWVGNPENC